ncbi:MAG: Flagellin N-methylase [Verrucomicrobiaceae bacterium]|nr:Flagellin N-methylase [Verrucomicrobiaceae bacterium]
MLSGRAWEAKCEKTMSASLKALARAGTAPYLFTVISDPAQAAARLCMDCGLCCNGVMFDMVMLQPGDNPRALKAHGLKVKRREHFRQPCIALCGTQCTIYQHRPTRCRLFECQQYQQVAAGTLAEAVAKARIEEVKQQVAHIEPMLEGISGSNPRKSLSQRYASSLAEPVEATTQRAELIEAMEKLQGVLTEHFRVG